jgi:hypothetical protein
MTIIEATRQLAERYVKMLGMNNDQHLRNMCLTIIDKVDGWPIDKSSRWMGYIQKGVIDLKLTSMERERNFSRPLFHQAYIDSGLIPPETRDADNIMESAQDTLISTLGFKYVVSFRNEESDHSDVEYMRDDIKLVHMVFFDEMPNISTVDGIFDELVHDAMFGMEEKFVKMLRMEILPIDMFLKIYGDFYITINS